jgi:hypothetical protein
MQRSDTIGALVGALAKAQAVIHNPPLDKVNPHFKNRYASLAAHLDAIRGPLAAQGIAVTQHMTTTETHIGVETLIAHASGEWIGSSVSMQLPDRPTAQQIGSCVTYLRRYALACATLIVGDEEDDGEADRTAPSRDAAPRYSSRPAEPRPAKTKPEPVAPAPARAVEPIPAQTGAPARRWKDKGGDVVLVKKCVARGDTQTAVLCSHPVDGTAWVCVPNQMLSAVKLDKTMELDWEWRTDGKDGGYYLATRTAPPPRLSDAATSVKAAQVDPEDVPF